MPTLTGIWGGALLQQGKLADAAASYRNTLNFSANNLEVLLNLGNILGELGKAG
jgi:cytochrome c-type biogenesis protein CcmH/NrfG